jgi:hypothetical protein
MPEPTTFAALAALHEHLDKEEHCLARALADTRARLAEVRARMAATLARFDPHRQAVSTGDRSYWLDEHGELASVELVDGRTLPVVPPVASVELDFTPRIVGRDPDAVTERSEIHRAIACDCGKQMRGEPCEHAV